MEAVEHSIAGRAESRCARPYVRRRPEEGVLDQVLREHLETFLAEARARNGEGLPAIRFYINRAGRNLPASLKTVLEKAKQELRAAFGRDQTSRGGP